MRVRAPLSGACMPAPRVLLLQRTARAFDAPRRNLLCAVLVAEVVQNFFPKLVELHNYRQACIAGPQEVERSVGLAAGQPQPVSWDGAAANRYNRRTLWHSNCVAQQLCMPAGHACWVCSSRDWGLGQRAGDAPGKQLRPHLQRIGLCSA
jgi:hypothetical protein